MEVGQGPNWGYSAKEKKNAFSNQRTPRIRNRTDRENYPHSNNYSFF
jgi:hypothetical protein